jgi:hypothetical protein
MKTAVDWLIDMLVTENQITLKGENYKLFEQAQAMEKEQMKKAYNHSRPNLLCYEKGTAFKEYYNETFKTN